MAGNKVRLFWEGRQNTLPDISYDGQPVATSRIYPHPVYEENCLWLEERQRPACTPENHMYFGDNLDVMKFLLQNGYENRFDLIYIDPPYLSHQKYLSRIEIGDKNSPQAVERQVFRDNGPERSGPFFGADIPLTAADKMPLKKITAPFSCIWTGMSATT